jgi:hypothetical protein
MYLYLEKKKKFYLFFVTYTMHSNLANNTHATQRVVGSAVRSFDDLCVLSLSLSLSLSQLFNTLVGGLIDRRTLLLT